MQSGPVLLDVRPDGVAHVRLNRPEAANAMNLDVGGIEVMIDDRDGVPRFYDINALSNFVAQPLNVLGWDPHEKLIDWLDTLIAEAKS